MLSIFSHCASIEQQSEQPEIPLGLLVFPILYLYLISMVSWFQDQTVVEAKSLPSRQSAESEL